MVLWGAGLLPGYTGRNRKQPERGWSLLLPLTYRTRFGVVCPVCRATWQGRNIVCRAPMPTTQVVEKGGAGTTLHNRQGPKDVRGQLLSWAETTCYDTQAGLAGEGAEIC